MLQQTPPDLAVFRPKMARIFLSCFEDHLATVEAYTSRDGLRVSAPIWEFQAHYEAKRLILELGVLRESLQKECANEQARGGALGGAGPKEAPEPEGEPEGEPEDEEGALEPELALDPVGASPSSGCAPGCASCVFRLQHRSPSIMPEA
jgi:hypothetical protein